CHAAVTDHQHRAVGELASEAAHRTQPALEDLLERLTAWPRDEAIVLPIGQPAHLVECRAGALADVDLDEVALHLDGHPSFARDRERRVERSRERRRDDAGEWRVAQRL